VVGVATDDDGHAAGLQRLGLHTGAVEGDDLAGEGRFVLAPERAQDLDVLAGSCPSPGPGNAEGVELLAEPPDANAQQ